MDNYSLHNRMQKMFLLVGMLGFLLLPNTAAAEFVDEYVAKHPRTKMQKGNILVKRYSNFLSTMLAGIV